MAAACPARRDGPEIPDLTDQSNVVLRRIERTDRIDEVMVRDLAKVELIVGDLATMSTEVFAPPFPLDLFKHVAVNCLNASAAETESALEGGALTPPTGFACQPRFLDRLQTRLEAEAPGSKARAFEILHRVDMFHTLRVRLRTRMGKIEEILDSNVRFLASRRADLRKLRTRWKERRPELSTARWKELKQRLARYGDELDRLESSTDALRKSLEGWPGRLDEANRKMYFAITSHWE